MFSSEKDGIDHWGAQKKIYRSYYIKTMNNASSHFLPYICTNQDRTDNKQANPHVSVVELNLSLLLTCLFSALALATTEGGRLTEQINFNKHLDFYAKGEKSSRGSMTHDSVL